MWTLVIIKATSIQDNISYISVYDTNYIYNYRMSGFASSWRYQLKGVIAKDLDTGIVFVFLQRSDAAVNLKGRHIANIPHGLEVLTISPCLHGILRLLPAGSLFYGRLNWQFSTRLCWRSYLARHLLIYM